ncbi:MAG: ABC transporter ATP-binding protein [Syntrophomonadaceae bacterium]|nr:ABC transporter ATP-binding protein [Syntrophomonadaceae bacterium]
MSFLKLSQVNFRYPKQEKLTLDNINLEIDQEQVTAVIGPNGSGKTTLSKVIIGVLPATGGQILLQGSKVEEYSLAQIGRRIGYVFQNPDLQLFCGTVAEEIGFGLINQGYEADRVKERVDFYLEYFHLAEYRQAFPLHLSQGEKQRVAIASVLATEPEFMILDEPTVGLDAYRKKILAAYLQKIARSGRGMILISHDMIFVNRLADRIIQMEKGCIVGDSDGKGDNDHDT